TPAPIAGTTRGFSRYSLAARANRRPKRVDTGWVKNVAEFVTKNAEPAKMQTANNPVGAPYRRNPRTYRTGTFPAAKIGLTSEIGTPAVDAAASTAGHPGGYAAINFPPILTIKNVSKYLSSGQGCVQNFPSARSMIEKYMHICRPT